MPNKWIFFKMVLAAPMALTAVLVSSPAHADDDFRDRGLMTPDGGSIYYCMLNSGTWLIPSDMQDEAKWAMDWSIDEDTTASVVSEGTSCDVSSSDGDGQTDIQFMEHALVVDGQAVRGLTSCESAPGTTGTCDRYGVTFNRAELYLGANDHEDLLKTACHEAGHTATLLHHDLGEGGYRCMLSGPIEYLNPGDPTSWELRNYSVHHQNHISIEFP